MSEIEAAEFVPTSERPFLLFDAKEIPEIRRRVGERPGYLDQVRENCRKIAATAIDHVDFEVARTPAQEARTLAEGYLLFDEKNWARWALDRVFYMLENGNWMPPVHQGGCPHYDHVMGNVAALLALTHDLLDNFPSDAENERIVEGMRRRVLLPFLAATRERTEWWSKAETECNWKIMTCGETGLALCGYAHEWPEAREALALAARGVVETLDRVPPEGDWPEGTGYWFATLFMGLRYAMALRRLTRGRVNIFEHPALRATGDFAVMLTTPAGRCYNFNDNKPSLDSEHSADCIRLLAAETGRRDWLALARSYKTTTILSLALDNPEMPAERTARLTAAFPRSGVATLRSGWEPHDTFVGFRSGPSDVPHSHLDANSFILESRSVPLLVDEGTWPYAGFIGFFDMKLRWNWDGNATWGHNTLLVDGQGQTWGSDHAG